MIYSSNILENMKNIKKIKPFHVDERGEMSHLLDGKVKITSALLISSRKGSIRANHYHKKDSHYCYLLKGRMEYLEKDLKTKNARRKKAIVKEGKLVYTPPMIAHAMRFLEDSVFLALTTEPRKQSKYEKDTIRMELI